MALLYSPLSLIFKVSLFYRLRLLYNAIYFDHKTNHFEAYNDSSFAYMENDFLYLSNSPADLGVPIGREFNPSAPRHISFSPPDHVANGHLVCQLA
jgi:hypothetical protein